MDIVISKPCKIYLSGKISGLTKREYGRNFRMAGWMLQLKHGRDNIRLVNPLELKPFLYIENYWCYMISYIFALIQCDAIHLQSNWTDSKGARILKWVAEKIGLQILYA